MAADTTQDRREETQVHGAWANLKTALNDRLLGQAAVVDELMATLLAGGHALLEGPPGLGKTQLATELGRRTDLTTQRIQFTPDLMPGDVTGSDIYQPDAEEAFTFMPGPVFTHLLIADEINRATPRTQSALLEAMQEGHVTVGGRTRPLPEPFMVVATQNPLEMQGTYPLPEAQLDRFSVKINVPRPSERDLQKILKQPPADVHHDPLMHAQDVLESRELSAAQPVADAAIAYVARLVEATHHDPRLALGSSPRGGQAIVRLAQAFSLMAGRAYVDLPDLKRAVRPALRHRVTLALDAQLDGTTPDSVLAELVARTPVEPPAAP